MSLPHADEMKRAGIPASTPAGGVSMGGRRRWRRRQSGDRAEESCVSLPLPDNDSSPSASATPNEGLSGSVPSHHDIIGEPRYFWIEHSRVVPLWQQVRQVMDGLRGQVPARLYVDAAFATISVIDALITCIPGAGAALGVARNDMALNAAGLRRLSDAASFDCTLQRMVAAEISCGEQCGVAFGRLLEHNSTCLCCLSWLQRSLSLIHLLLHLLESDRAMPVRECLLRAYEGSLSRFHGLVGRTAFAVAARAFHAERRAFAESIGPDEPTVYAALSVMLPDMAAALQATEDFLVEVGVETQPAEQRCGPMATPRVALV